MLCQSCEKRQATTHIKTIMHGELKEYRLCAECAAKLGYGSFFSDFGLDLDKFFGSFMESFSPERSSKRCSFCGSDFASIARSGKVGCAHCYEVFYDDLLPSIQRIHGQSFHAGKLASSAGEELKMRSEIESCRRELEKAIKTQEFERAAQLRDRIRELEKRFTVRSEQENKKEG